MTRKNAVAAARGDQPFDLVLRDVQLINVFTAELSRSDIGIVGNLIAAVGPANTLGAAHAVIEGNGCYAAPGFIDGHVHNESSMCTPAQWARVIVPKGTTTVLTDPHEIGNVLGLPGIRYMLEASEGLPYRYYVTASSCIPAVPSVETAGATVTDKEMEEMLAWDRVMAVAEAMDYPGLIQQSGNITPIVEAGHRREVPIEGHAPGVVDTQLQAYLAAAGPRSSDHEAITTEEMLEKVRAGMMVYARASSYRDGTAEIAAAMNEVDDWRLFGFCTDDILPHDLLRMGHMEYGMRRLIDHGTDPVRVIQMATINVAAHYGLHGIGAIAPGWLADLVLLDDLESVSVTNVIVDGKLIVAGGEWQVEVEEPVPPLMEHTVHLQALSVDGFLPSFPLREGKVRVNAIDASQLFTSLTSIELDVEDGKLLLPLPADISMAAIVPRHGQKSPPSLAFLSGYPLRGGAIASTIAHDSHNLAIIGKTPEAMLAAAHAIHEMQGGLVAVEGIEVLASVLLPIAGLMSAEPVPVIAEQLEGFINALPQLGLTAEFPLPLVALALPVIPEVRLSDKGIVNVATQQLIPMIP